MNKELIEQTFANYEIIMRLAENFYKEKTNKSYPNLRFDECGNILHKVNDSCNCHPKYIWEIWDDSHEFIDWIDKNREESTENK